MIAALLRDMTHLHEPAQIWGYRHERVSARAVFPESVWLTSAPAQPIGQALSARWTRAFYASHNLQHNLQTFLKTEPFELGVLRR